MQPGCPNGHFDEETPYSYNATFDERWRGTLHNIQGDEIENSGDEFFVSDLAVFKWAKSKGVTRRLDQ